MQVMYELVRMLGGLSMVCGSETKLERLKQNPPSPKDHACALMPGRLLIDAGAPCEAGQAHERGSPRAVGAQGPSDLPHTEPAPGGMFPLELSQHQNVCPLQVVSLEALQREHGTAPRESKLVAPQGDHEPAAGARRPHERGNFKCSYNSLRPSYSVLGRDQPIAEGKRET